LPLDELCDISETYFGFFGSLIDSREISQKIPYFTQPFNIKFDELKSTKSHNQKPQSEIGISQEIHKSLIKVSKNGMRWNYNSPKMTF
jgi:hypothetical protein